VWLARGIQCVKRRLGQASLTCGGTSKRGRHRHLGQVKCKETSWRYDSRQECNMTQDKNATHNVQDKNATANAQDKDATHMPQASKTRKQENQAAPKLQGHHPRHNAHDIQTLSSKPTHTCTPTNTHTGDAGAVWLADLLVQGTGSLRCMRTDSNGIGLTRPLSLSHARHHTVQSASHAHQPHACVSGKAWGTTEPFDLEVVRHPLHDERLLLIRGDASIFKTRAPKCIISVVCSQSSRHRVFKNKHASCASSAWSEGILVFEDVSVRKGVRMVSVPSIIMPGVGSIMMAVIMMAGVIFLRALPC
jgi:hypothetical protein